MICLLTARPSWAPCHFIPSSPLPSHYMYGVALTVDGRFDPVTDATPCFPLQVLGYANEYKAQCNASMPIGTVFNVNNCDLWSLWSLSPPHSSVISPAVAVRVCQPSCPGRARAWGLAEAVYSIGVARGAIPPRIQDWQSIKNRTLEGPMYF